MAGQRRTATAGDARASGGDGAGAFLRGAFAVLHLLWDHRGNAAATRRAIEQAYRGTAQVERQAVEIAALCTDGAIGVSAAGGEIVGAYHARSSVDLAPATDVIGRRKVRNAALIIIAGESRQAADLMKAVLVQQQIDAFAASQFSAAALANNAGVERAGRETAMGNVLQRLHFGKQRRPGVVAMPPQRPRVVAAMHRDDRSHNLAGGDAVADA